MTDIKTSLTLAVLQQVRSSYNTNLILFGVVTLGIIQVFLHSPLSTDHLINLAVILFILCFAYYINILVTYLITVKPAKAILKDINSMQDGDKDKLLARIGDL